MDAMRARRPMPLAYVQVEESSLKSSVSYSLYKTPQKRSRRTDSASSGPFGQASDSKGAAAAEMRVWVCDDGGAGAFPEPTRTNDNDGHLQVECGPGPGPGTNALPAMDSTDPDPGLSPLAAPTRSVQIFYDHPSAAVCARAGGVGVVVDSGSELPRSPVSGGPDNSNSPHRAIDGEAGGRGTDLFILRGQLDSPHAKSPSSPSSDESGLHAYVGARSEGQQSRTHAAGTPAAADPADPGATQKEAGSMNSGRAKALRYALTRYYAAHAPENAANVDAIVARVVVRPTPPRPRAPAPPRPCAPAPPRPRYTIQIRGCWLA